MEKILDWRFDKVKQGHKAIGKSVKETGTSVPLAYALLADACGTHAHQQRRTKKRRAVY